MPGYSVPYVHTGDPGYAPPLIRAPSPTDSIGTDYGPDETTEAEARWPDQEFDKVCQRGLQLDVIRPDELRANYDPLLPKTKTEEERKRRAIIVAWPACSDAASPSTAHSSYA